MSFSLAWQRRLCGGSAGFCTSRRRTTGGWHVKASSSGSSSAGGGGDAAPRVPDAMPVAGPDTDWRTFRARLAAMEPAAGGGRAAGGQGGGSGAAGPAAFSDERWAHALPGPEAGAVLLAHPSMFSSSQTYFRLAAILMLEVGDGGALGVILNRPTEHTLGQVQFAGDDGALVAPFRDNTLWLGGDVGESSIIVVTSSPAVAEATEVAAGLRVCSISAAAAAVEAGRAVPDDFRFFAQYSGWGPGQLQRECKAGVWFVAAASAGLVLDAEPAAAGPELWHQVLNTMGGPYQELSQLIKEGEGESKRATTQQQQQQQQQDQPSSGDDVA